MAAAILCFGLSGCSQENKQDAANPEDALNIFLTGLQTNDFATAVTYMKEGNELIHVFAAVEGGEASLNWMESTANLLNKWAI